MGAASLRLLPWSNCTAFVTHTSPSFKWSTIILYNNQNNNNTIIIVVCWFCLFTVVVVVRSGIEEKESSTDDDSDGTVSGGDYTTVTTPSFSFVYCVWLWCVTFITKIFLCNFFVHSPEVPPLSLTLVHSPVQ